MAYRIKVHLIAAARPNFMKVAPLYHALQRDGGFDVKLVHTGQHYDANMSQAFFDDLGLPEPDFYLEVGSGSHAEQTGAVMVRYEKTAQQDQPDITIVVGDVNSTAAVALVCAKLCIPVVHLEAGLRSGDRSMPEEVNRLITDAIADLLWTPSPDGDANLRKEGVAESRVCRVGNIMLDSFELLRDRIEADGTAAAMGLDADRYGLVTLHRPANVDKRTALDGLTRQLIAASELLPLVFPVHPRTRNALVTHELMDRLTQCGSVTLIEPLGYIQFMNLVRRAELVITDSGGLQEETTYLGIPCLTLRPNTERPITITEGTNRLVEPNDLLNNVRQAVAGDWPTGRKPDLWDGRAAGRCVASLKEFFAANP